ncbi:MAG: hypothetical protein Q4E37_01410 [Tissierellia bacterium]|nr:hypothetical protein [Tissierellia bacterium]
MQVQEALNKKANINIKAVKPKLNQGRINGLVNKMAEYEDFDEGKWLLDEPVINFTQAVVDDTIKANADFQYKAGLHPEIVRKEAGNCCEWCKTLVGVYAYPEEVPEDVWRRHRYCRCTVDYLPGDGKKQDIWSKKWTDVDRDDKIKERIEYNSKSAGASGAKNYFRDESKDYIKDSERIRKEKHAYLMYDEIKNSNQEIIKRKIFNNINTFEEMKDFSKEDVDIAFNHVFNDLHDLENGKMLFEPEYEMAQSWTRLINNRDIQSHDLILLKHERLEHDLMYRHDMKYQEAHDRVSEIYLYKVPEEDK